MTEIKLDKYNCPHCEFKAKERSSLTIHLSYKHKRVIKWYFCPFDDYKVTNRDTLNAHMVNKHIIDDKDINRAKVALEHAWYKCYVDGYKAMEKSDFIYHMVHEHSVECLYKCPHCDYTSKNIKNVHAHILSKHIDKVETLLVRNRCPYCDYKTETREELTNHIDLHIVE